MIIDSTQLDAYVQAVDEVKRAKRTLKRSKRRRREAEQRKEASKNCRRLNCRK